VRVRITVRAGQDHRLADIRQGQFRRQGGRRCGEGGHAGRHVVSDLQRVQPAHLLGDRAIERRVAGMDPGDIVALFVGGLHLGDDLVQMHRRGIDHPRPFGRLGHHLRRHQRPGIKHDGGTPNDIQPPNSNKIRSPRPRAYEVNCHGVLPDAGVLHEKPREGG
jgi:hypothetical protein